MGNWNLVERVQKCLKGNHTGEHNNCTNDAGEVHHKCCSACPERTCFGRSTQLVIVKEYAKNNYTEYLVAKEEAKSKKEHANQTANSNGDDAATNSSRKLRVQ